MGKRGPQESLKSQGCLKLARAQRRFICLLYPRWWRPSGTSGGRCVCAAGRPCRTGRACGLRPVPAGRPGRPGHAGQSRETSGSCSAGTWGAAPHPDPPRRGLGSCTGVASLVVRWVAGWVPLQSGPEAYQEPPGAAKAKRASRSDPWRPPENPDPAELPDRGRTHPAHLDVCGEASNPRRSLTYLRSGPRWRTAPGSEPDVAPRPRCL